MTWRRLPSFMARLPDLVPPEAEALRERVRDAAFRVHRALGPGFLESIYRRCLIHALRLDGLEVEEEVWLPIEFEGLVLDRAHRADMIVGGMVLVEVKAAEALHPMHKAQTISYLKASGAPVAELLNFGGRLLAKNRERLVHPDLLGSAATIP